MGVSRGPSPVIDETASHRGIASGIRFEFVRVFQEANLYSIWVSGVVSNIERIGLASLRDTVTAIE